MKFPSPNRNISDDEEKGGNSPKSPKFRKQMTIGDVNHRLTEQLKKHMSEITVKFHNIDTQIQLVQNKEIEHGREILLQSQVLSDYNKKIEANFQKISMHSSQFSLIDEKMKMCQHLVHKTEETLGQQMNLIARDIRNFKTWQDEVNTLFGEIEKLKKEKADVTSLNFIKDRIFSDMPDMKQFTNECDHLQNKIYDLQQIFTNHDANFTKFERAQKDTNKVNKRSLDEHSANISEQFIKQSKNTTKIKKHDETLKLHGEQISTKEEILVVEKLRSRLDVFSDVENVKQLKEVFLPKIIQFTNKIEALEENNEDVKRCIRQFDLDISIKCNKTSLELFKQFVEDNHIPNTYKDVIKDNMNEMKENIKESDVNIMFKFDTFKNGLENHIHNSIEQRMEEFFARYQKIAKSFEQFFNVEELGSLLDRKADLELIRRINDQKANKTDIKDISGILDAINIKLKHMSVYQSELANILLPQKQTGMFKTGEDLNDNIQKREKLIREGKIMCNWVQKTVRGFQDTQQTYPDLKQWSNCNTLQFNDSHLSSDNENDNRGRNKALLSGCSTQRRHETFRVLKKDHQFGNISPRNSNSPKDNYKRFKGRCFSNDSIGPISIKQEGKKLNLVETVNMSPDRITETEDNSILLNRQFLTHRESEPKVNLKKNLKSGNFLNRRNKGLIKSSVINKRDIVNKIKVINHGVVSPQSDVLLSARVFSAMNDQGNIFDHYKHHKKDRGSSNSILMNPDNIIKNKNTRIVTVDDPRTPLGNEIDLENHFPEMNVTNTAKQSRESISKMVKIPSENMQSGELEKLQQRM